MLVLWLFVACDMFTPSYVNRTDIDQAMASHRWNTVCVGLQMDDDLVREHATRRLRSVTDKDGIEVANTCICENVVDPVEGWDRVIAASLGGETDDDKVNCLAALAAQDDIPDRLELVTALGHIPAPSAKNALIGVATAPGAVEPRVAALEYVGAIEDYRDAVLTILAGPEDENVRAAAASALGGATRNNALVDALEAGCEDESGVVRGSSLAALKRVVGTSADKRLCEAMMSYPSPDVRRQAIGAFQGTRRTSIIECLRERAFAHEEDASVRQKLLDVLKSSPKQKAADVLCDAIGFWMRSYVIEDLPDRIPGTDIAKVQNDRDWDRSYECLQRAYRNRSGMSCHARMYVGWWYREVGGQGVHIPDCPR